MRSRKLLLIKQLDEKLDKFKIASTVPYPESGWIYLLRNSLNMTLAQLGKKIGSSRQRVKYIEDSEAGGKISINMLKEVGDALGLKLVYGFVPREGSIEEMVDKRAKTLATKIVMSTNQNMILEDQGIGNEKLNAAISELAYDIKREMRRTLWD